jgi:hypothetical protein
MSIVAIKDDEDFQAMQARLVDLLPRLNERDRRVAIATEAKSWGRGGISAVQGPTGASRVRSDVVWPNWPATHPKCPIIESGHPEMGARKLKSPIQNWLMRWTLN